MIAEGVFAADIVYDLACEKNVDMPITTAVYRMLRGETNPLSLVTEIMTRTPKREDR